MPREGVKRGVGDPLKRIAMEVVDTHDIIREINLGGKLKKVKARLIKLHSIQSNVFSRSIFRSILGYFDLEFLNELVILEK